MISYETKFRVRYAETDQMRIAHHANYIVWFELARVGLLEKINITIQDLESRGYLIPVLEVSARYIKSAKFDETLSIRAELSKVSRAKLRFDYTICSAEDEILCSGYSLHGFMNRKNKAVKPPEDFQKIIREI